MPRLKPIETWTADFSNGKALAARLMRWDRGLPPTGTTFVSIVCLLLAAKSTENDRSGKAFILRHHDGDMTIFNFAVSGMIYTAPVMVRALNPMRLS